MEQSKAIICIITEWSMIKQKYIYAVYSILTTKLGILKGRMGSQVLVG